MVKEREQKEGKENQEKVQKVERDAQCPDQSEQDFKYLITIFPIIYFCSSQERIFCKIDNSKLNFLLHLFDVSFH